MTETSQEPQEQGSDKTNAPQLPDIERKAELEEAAAVEEERKVQAASEADDEDGEAPPQQEDASP
jgi:hypothetical protein